MNNGNSEYANDRLLREQNEKFIDDLESTVELILRSHNYERSSLISILLDIQEEYNYLPKDALVFTADKLDIRLIEVFSVASFYKIFSLTPRGKYVINVCTGTACHVRGGRRIVDRIRKKLDIEIGETTTDGRFTLETLRCLGACALGPIVVVDGEYHGQMNATKLDAVLQKYNDAGTGNV